MRDHPVIAAIVAALIFLGLQLGMQAMFSLSPGQGTAVTVASLLLLIAFLGWVFGPHAQSRFFVRSMTREQLEKRYPIQRQVEKARTIHGLMLAGLALLQLDDKIIKGTVERLILPSNKLELLRRLAPLYGAADHILGADILKATQRAKDLRIPVKWLDTFPGFTMLLADPDEADGWIHVEVLMPEIRPNQHPVFRVLPKRVLENVGEG